jgi:hypothetical protein
MASGPVSLAPGWWLTRMDLRGRPHEELAPLGLVADLALLPSSQKHHCPALPLRTSISPSSPERRRATEARLPSRAEPWAPSCPYRERERECRSRVCVCAAVETDRWWPGEDEVVVWWIGMVVGPMLDIFTSHTSQNGSQKNQLVDCEVERKGRGSPLMGRASNSLPSVRT